MIRAGRTRGGIPADKKTATVMLLTAVIIILLIIIFALLPENGRGDQGAAENAKNTVTFFDVKQGDGALIKSGGECALIDAGTPEGATDLCRRLKAAGVKSLNTMLLTHNHDDHVGGAGKVAGKFRIKNAVLPDLTNTASPTRILGTVKKQTEAAGGSCTVGRSGLFYEIGDVKLSLLCCYLDFEDENDRSIVCIAETDGKRFLFTGDAGTLAEERMIADGIDFDCDVLKVGHHGSSDASSARFLALATPDYAVISCGAGNRYGHPHGEAVARLKNAGATVLRTDLMGDITFFVDNNSLEYITED